MTLIGMIFGNAAVIATLSSNDGAKVYIANQLATLGNKLMTVSTSGVAVKNEDLSVLNHYADEIEIAVREQVAPNATARGGKSVSQVGVFAVDPEYFNVMNLEIATGRVYLRQESDRADTVVLLGHRVKSEIFGSNPAVNEFVSIAIGGEPLLLRVIGVFKEKGGTSGGHLDRGVFIGGRLGQKITRSGESKVLVLLKDDNRSAFAKDQINGLWSQKFKESLRIIDAREAIERTRAIWSKQNLVGICLAAISLLTGGVGIMNIMLLSIHQRQKEIGIRKAVGAKNREIAAQFLIETVIICILGGIVGVGVGWGFGKQIASMLGDWQASLSLVSVMVALGFSVLTGVIFGALPALRAARIDPYDALRTG